MRTYILFAICLCFFNCNTSKSTTNQTVKNSKKQPCPDDGKCSVILHQNKQLHIKKDDLGSLYYSLVDSKNTAVIAFEYKKHTDATLQDGHYSEEILFEIQNDTQLLELNDADLQITKMIFGRHCYCKGMAGYFSVTNGRLNLKKEHNKYNLSLQFKVNEVPQVLNSIIIDVQ